MDHSDAWQMSIGNPTPEQIAAQLGEKTPEAYVTEAIAECASACAGEQTEDELREALEEHRDWMVAQIETAPITYAVHTQQGTRVLNTATFHVARDRVWALVKAHGSCSLSVDDVEFELPGVAYEYLCRLADRRYEQTRTRYEPTREDHRLARVYAASGEVGHDDL